MSDLTKRIRDAIDRKLDEILPKTDAFHNGMYVGLIEAKKIISDVMKGEEHE